MTKWLGCHDNGKLLLHNVSILSAKLSLKMCDCFYFILLANDHGTSGVINRKVCVKMVLRQNVAATLPYYLNEV